MKTKNLFLMYSLLAGLGLMPDFRLTAQTFTTLHSFSATSGEFSGATNSDGVYPADGVIQSGNILYGTAVSGGGSGYGTVYSLNTDGTGFTNVHTFDGYPGDGDHPYAGLLSVGDTLYGTTVGGGNRGWGTVFAISTNGTGLSILHSFTSAYGSPNVTNSDGAGPYGYGGLIRSGYTLYGTAFGGGSSGHGVVFRVNTDGTGFTNLHSFTAGSGGYPIVTNSDGAYPLAGLTLSGSALFGAAESGGTSGNGTVFAVNTDGSGFTTVHSFAAGSSSYPHTTNSDGAQPLAALVLAGSTLYGTANSGGDWGNGTVFAVNTNGSGFTILHSFTAGSGTYPTVTNSDGANPFGGLILSGNTLYGTADTGGSSGNGTVFAVNCDGTGFTNLYNFAAGVGTYPMITNSDGAHPGGRLSLSRNTLYGTAEFGGSSGNGTVFSLSFRPQLTITPSGAYVVLQWPTNYAGFDYTGFTVESTANLVLPVAWTTESPGQVVGEEEVVVSLVSGAQQYYRLSDQTQQTGRCFHNSDCPPGYRCIIPFGATVGTCSKY